MFCDDIVGPSYYLEGIRMDVRTAGAAGPQLALTLGYFQTHWTWGIVFGTTIDVCSGNLPVLLARFVGMTGGFLLWRFTMPPVWRGRGNMVTQTQLRQDMHIPLGGGAEGARLLGIMAVLALMFAIEIAVHGLNLINVIGLALCGALYRWERVFRKYLLPIINYLSSLNHTIHVFLFR